MSNRSPSVFRGACLLLAVVLTTSCALPRIHRVTVQQGNVITQEMVDQLKPGMTREQVAFVMGQPVVRNAFNDARWDYVYTIDVPGSFESRLLMSLFFEGDALTLITGDLAPTPAAPTPAAPTPAAEATTAATGQ